MNDPPVEYRRGDLLISTDRNRLNVDTVLELLHTTFWAREMTRDVLSRAIANSINFGLFQHDELLGYGRAVSDLSTYAYWTDVVIAPARRGQGLGRWLSECMLKHPGLQGLRRVSLLTRDAAGLYSRVGFAVGAGDLVYMEYRG
jgi:ribosomal protein S18 acetylase RimI-like enzyme